MIRALLLLSALALTAPAFAEAPATEVTATADRFIPMDGGRNFRDVGGYHTADGHLVKAGLLYRSGSLGKLTPAGQERLRSLHIANVVDLRTTDERSRDTFNVRSAVGNYWSRDYDMSKGDLSALFGDRSKVTAETTHAMISGAYVTLPREQAPSYRALFAALTAADGPVVVNCTAGKDRTGIATALVLTALGVPYETVRQDFLLSNGAPGMGTLHADLSPPLAALPADVVAPLIVVDGAYLDAAFATLRKDYGSVENYMQKELGVGPGEIARLRARMLQ